MSEKDKQDWENLYEYVKKDILNYSKEKQLPKSLILRLKGLSEGKFMANKNIKSYGKYSFEIILLSFKLSKFDLIMALKDKDKFKDESHMINYMMVIVEKKINDVYDMLKRKKDCEERVKEVQVQEISKQEYKRKTEENTNSRLSSIW